MQNAPLRSVLFSLLFTVCALAQRDLGTITGTVTDAQGAAVPGARVTIVEDATGLSYNVQTNETGEYVRPLLKPGTYSVSVEAQGFRKTEQKGVIVTAGDRIGVNLALQIGNLSETVEVQAAAPLLQTETTSQGADLNVAAVSELPLGGQRIFTFLARLSPGVLTAEQGARDAQGGGFSANGVRSTGENNFLLNGVDNNVNVIDFINQTSFVIGPSVEAIGELRILTNGYNAEYGRAAGGVLDASLKAGTNQVHGVLFENLQNTDLDANRWENNFSNLIRPPVNQNQFGAAAGGPIIKNKLFIFGDYQGTRIKTAGGVVQNLGFGGLYTIPTPAMVQGDFSGILGGSLGTDPVTGQNVLYNQIFDPNSTKCVSACGTSSAVYSRLPFQGNKIPKNMLDPAAIKIASLYPSPNQPIKAGDYPQNDYGVLTPGTLTTDQGDGRVDYRIDDKNSLFGSLSWSNTSKTNVAPFQGALDGANFYGASEQDLGRNAQLGYTRIWSPSIISETRIGYSRLVTARTQGNANTDEFKAVGIGGYDPTTSLNGGLPQFSFNSGKYSQVGANDWLPTKEFSNVWDFIQNVSITKGSHALKFGVEFRPIGLPFFQVPYPHGEMNFSNTETSLTSNASDKGAPGAKNGTFSADTGDPFASFMLGALNGGQISTTNFISSTRKAYAFYGQDDWKVSRTFTVQLGLRYELWSPMGEQFARQSNFNFDTLTLEIPKGPNQDAALPPNFNTPYTLNGITYPALFPSVKVSRGQVDQYLIPWDKLDLGPRVGFAWNLREKTVIRAAYGIFYGGEEQQGGNPNRGESAPFNESPQLNRPAGVNSFDPNPFFAGGAPIGGIAAGFPLNVFTTQPVSSLQFRSVAQDFRNPMVQKWNVAVQQQLPSQMAFELGYQGNHQSHQLLQPDFNAAPNFATTSSISTNSIRPVPELGSISGTASFGFGNYDAMTAKLEKRLSRGLQFITAYTWGHALANSGTTLSGSSGFNFKDNRNISTSYSSAAWDIRHNFTTGFNYDIPFGRGKAYGANMNRVLDAAIGGWQANGILTLHTGQPFTLRSNGCQGIWATCFPDVVPGKDPNAAPAGGRRPQEWFDITNVTAPASLTQGDIGLQTNYGPPTRTVDFSLAKSFRFTERWMLQFRGEAFNIANTPQFSLPDNNRQDANFGAITSTQAGSERHIQFALRLQF
ncbi:MAG TPA: carboxypeptidase-like regulatory domain-containing protein [Bryobacteraceae bacterium]|nr:carboxypeptidase-like regulatory domain-containing protein [Bryobacteraceae bacterium]